MLHNLKWFKQEVLKILKTLKDSKTLKDLTRQ